MLYEQQVTAGAPLQLNVPGRFFLLDSTGAESVVTVTLLRGGSPIFGQIPGARRGLKIGVENAFDGVRIEADGDTTVRFFATFENVSISTADGAEVSVPGGVEVINTGANPVPVVHTGTVELTASNVGITQKAVTVAGAGYTVTAAGVAVSAAANANRRAIHFRNAGAVDIYLAAFAAAAIANCPLLLRPGECLLVDDRSAAAQWKAFTAAVDAELVVQEASE